MTHTGATNFIWFLFSVGGALSVLLVAALWICLRPHAVWPRRLLLATAIGYTLASIFAVSHTASRLLVIGYNPLQRSDVPAGRSAVVLLASGNYTARDWSGNKFSIVDPVTASRVLEAARVFHLVNPDWVISSGGVPMDGEADVPTALTMREALVQLGVPPDRIVVEAQSWNTHVEAEIIAPMLASLQVEHTVLVTSDVHMRRSMGAFRAEGIEPIPAIARHPLADMSRQEWLLPSADGLFETSLLAHEVMGIVYYAIRGWYRF